MLYLLYGTEEYLIKKEVNKIIQKNKIDEINISKYDLLQDNIKDVIEDATTMSLFSDNKLIICDNAFIFTRKKVKSNFEQDTESLLNYMNNFNPSTIIIFIVNSDNVDSVKKITKQIKKVGTVKDYNKENNIVNIIKEMFDGYSIDNKIINMLIDRVGEDLIKLSNEVDKLKMYKYEEKQILEEDVENLISKNVDADIFKLIEAVIKNDKKTSVEIYHEMIKYNEEPIKIIITLANQVRLIYQTKELYSRGYTQYDISKKLDVHPYRIKLALQNGSMYSSDRLIKILSELSNLDLNIKNGRINKDIAFDVFLLGL